jgi:hypothetical protein
VLKRLRTLGYLVNRLTNGQAEANEEMAEAIEELREALIGQFPDE